MKVLIAGSRGFEDKKLLFETLDNYNKNISEIISGKARGADSIGEQYALENNIAIKEFPAEWDVYGKRAGMVRNEQMGNYADIAFIFWDGVSKGTKNMISYMGKLGKPCMIINYKDSDILGDF